MPFFWRRRKRSADTQASDEPSDLVHDATRARSLPADTSSRALVNNKYFLAGDQRTSNTDGTAQIIRYDPRQKRHTSYTDTTIKSIDADARTIQVRRSGFIFSPKPKLRYSHDHSYPKTPEGHLPTLRRKLEASPFVDDIADELDTNELRQVLETDSRRRSRRQSKMLQSHASSTGHTHRSGLFVTDSTPPRPPAVPAIFQRATESSYDAPSTRSNGPANPITGRASDWHDAASIAPAIQARLLQDTEVVLAGNRDSYPDFSVTDKSARVGSGDSGRPGSRGSTGNALSGAWTSLWKRASTARARKERDVASHYGSDVQTTTAVDPRPFHTGRRDSLASLAARNEEEAAALEDLDATPQHATIMVLHPPTTQQRASIQTLQDEDGEALVQRVPQPEDFQPAPALFPAPRAELQVVQRQVKTFSPLLDGAAFPRPPSQTGMTAAHAHAQAMAEAEVVLQAWPQQGQVSPLQDLEEEDQALPPSQPLWQRAYMTPASAIGPVPRSIPAPAQRITHEANQAYAMDGDHAEARQSMQSVDSEGSWLADRSNNLDVLVKRSFSRKYEQRPGSRGARRSQQSHSAQDEQEIQAEGDAGWESAEDGASELSTDDEGEALIRGDPEDDADEYERGIWKTGIGKCVKIVSAGLVELGPDSAGSTAQTEFAHNAPLSNEEVSPGATSGAVFATADSVHVRAIPVQATLLPVNEAISPGTPSTATFSPPLAQPSYVQPIAAAAYTHDKVERPFASRATTRDSFVSANSFASSARTVHPYEAVYDNGPLASTRASLVTSQASYYTARMAPESRGSDRA